MPDLLPSHSWFCVRSRNPPVGFTNTINSQKLLRRLLPICTMWFPFIEDLGHTLSVTTQDTRYVSCRYWPHRVSQSSEDWVHTFSSTTPALGVESTPDNCGIIIVPSTISAGSMSHLSRSIHSKYTSTTNLSFNTPWVKINPKVLCYNHTDGVSLSS